MATTAEILTLPFSRGSLAGVGAKRLKGDDLSKQQNFELQKLRIRLAAKRVDAFALTVKSVFQAAPLVVGCICVYYSVAALAGHVTTVNGIVKALFDLKANEWFAAIFGGAATVAWVRERRLRHRANAEQGTHLQQLEERLDPKRSSSKLLPSGKPKEEDRQ